MSKSTKFICVIIFLLIFLGVLSRVTGSRIIDELENPIAIKEVTHRFIILEDGTKIKFKGIGNLPAQSPVFQNALIKGVEVSPDGKVYGLLKIWHFCGNDPVKEHIAKIDLGILAGLLDYGQIQEDIPYLEKELYLHVPEAQHFINEFTEWGWREINYWRYNEFKNYLDAHSKFTFNKRDGADRKSRSGLR